MIAQGRIDELNDRTVGAFAGVAFEYRRHASRVAHREIKPQHSRVNQTHAISFYLEAARKLETYDQAVA